MEADVKFWTKLGIGSVLATILLIGGCTAAIPQYNLYKANTEKQSVIREQEAQSKAAEYAATSAVIQAEAKAKAQVIQAQAIADSNRIIASTITPEYIQYLYVQALADTDNKVIYVPTEGGIPILEAGRVGAEVTPAPADGG